MNIKKIVTVRIFQKHTMVPLAARRCRRHRHMLFEKFSRPQLRRYLFNYLQRARYERFLHSISNQTFLSILVCPKSQLDLNFTFSYQTMAFLNKNNPIGCDLWMSFRLHNKIDKCLLDIS